MGCNLPYFREVERPSPATWYCTLGHSSHCKARTKGCHFLMHCSSQECGFMNTKHTETPLISVTVLKAGEGHGLPEVIQQSVKRELSTARSWPLCSSNMYYPSFFPSRVLLTLRHTTWVGMAFYPCDPLFCGSRCIPSRRQRWAEGHGQWGKATRTRGTSFLCCCWWFLPLRSCSILPWFGSFAPSHPPPHPTPPPTH